MPTYVYEIVLPDGSAGDRFEVEQRMSDEPLSVHPETGEPVRRVFLPAGIVGRRSLRSPEKSLQDDKKLAKLGFTKYVKSGDGKYEKTAGAGPKTIQRN